MNNGATTVVALCKYCQSWRCFICGALCKQRLARSSEVEKQTGFGCISCKANLGLFHVNVISMRFVLWDGE